MRSSSTTREAGFRRSFSKLRQQLARFRPRSRESSSDVRSQRLPLDTSGSECATDTKSVSPASSLPLIQASDFSKTSTITRNDEAQTQPNQDTLQTCDPRLHSLIPSESDDDTDIVLVASDRWSAAYRDAVLSLGKDLDIAILKGKNVAQLFEELQRTDLEAFQESAFSRGVKYLHSIKVPLESFKLALDLASPLTSVEPTAATVFGVVRSVTAIAISFAAADLEFAKHIGEMLDHFRYIDECDTLGQKINKDNIHEALVCVYRKILEFYKVAYEMLTTKGVKIVMTFVLQNDRLPNIIKDFLSRVRVLQNLVQNATLEIVNDIKAMLYDREIAEWLDIRKLNRQSQYHDELRSLRADQACEFLLTDTNLINWYDASDSRQLLILGETGFGKSVSMAYLVDELTRKNEIPRPKICYYFCRDDETGRAINIFSTLILEILEQFSGLKKMFYELYKNAQASGSFQPASSITELENFLYQVLETIDRPLFIVIDGLDECDRASRNRLLSLLKNLLQKTPRLKVLLSSRPHGEILKQLHGTSRIDLGFNAERDRIIVEKTVEKQLSYLSEESEEEVKALVINRVSTLMRGSAIWTKMVVGLIATREIHTIGPMRSFLDNLPLPDELSELYITVLKRSTLNDPANWELASIALRVLAVARRPLSVSELAWAVALSTAEQHVVTVAALGQLVDCSRVMSLIQPFITSIDSNDLKERQIRLSHQSMKEFVIDFAKPDVLSLQISTISASADRTALELRLQSLEEAMLNICIRYLLLDDVDGTALFSDELAAIEELPQEVDLFDNKEGPVYYDPYCTWETWEENMIRYDPTERGFGELFVYASCCWLEHFGAIKIGPLPDLAKIERLCQAGSTRIQNWTKQNCRPDCVIKARFPFESNLYDPLSITALYGSEAMLYKILRDSELNPDKFRPRTAIRAAEQVLLWGDVSRLKILVLDKKVGHQLQSLDFFWFVLRQWSGHGRHRCNWTLVFDLVVHMSDMLVQKQFGNELLCMAARAGCIPMVQRLMTASRHNTKLRDELLRGASREQNPPCSSKSVHQSIGEAVLGNHIDVVKYLFEEEGIEAHLQHVNSRGENVLHLASLLCNPAMFRLLVSRFPEGLLQTDSEGKTVLIRIIMSHSNLQDRVKSARTVLLQGRDNQDNFLCDQQQNPLRIAVRLGDLDMCRLLICDGKMSPLMALRVGREGQMFLKDVTPENQHKVPVMLELLRSHVNIASKPAE